jgi:methionyl-tRNA synthetase
MKKTIKLTEADLTRIIKRVIEEQPEEVDENISNKLENKIIKLLNEADEKLNKREFKSLAESVIDYIDEISRSKRND